MNSITAHPKLVTFGIGLAFTFVIGTAIGMVDHNQVFGNVIKQAGGGNHQFVNECDGSRLDP